MFDHAELGRQFRDAVRPQQGDYRLGVIGHIHAGNLPEIVEPTRAHGEGRVACSPNQTAMVTDRDGHEPFGNQMRDKFSRYVVTVPAKTEAANEEQ